MADIHIFDLPPPNAGETLTFDFATQLITASSGVDVLLVQDLVNGLSLAEESTDGMVFNRIAKREGKPLLDPSDNTLGPITVTLLESWKIATSKTTGNFLLKGGNVVNPIEGFPLETNTLVNQQVLNAEGATIVPAAQADITAIGVGVWAALITANKAPGSFGEFVQDFLLTVIKFLSLKDE